MQTHLEYLLEKQKNRCIRGILGSKEREADQYLPSDVSYALRKAIMDFVNEYHSVCIDLVESLDQGTIVVNELFVEKLNEIHKVLANGDSHD